MKTRSDFVTHLPSSSSRRDFILTGSKTLAGLSLLGMILTNACTRNYRQTKNENLKPLKIGLIGEKSDFKFYAQTFKKISSASFEIISREAALQGQTDAVIIAAPLKERAYLAKHILKAGSHVLVESPMAMSYEEFDAILLQINQQNKRLAVAHFHRFLKSAIQARALINEIGQINVISIQVDSKTSTPLLSRYREGFIGKGTPLLDLVCWLCAKSPLSLYAHKNLFAFSDKPEKKLHLFIELGRIPLLYSTVPTTLQEISDGWTITIYGKKKHLKLSANGGLQRFYAEEGQWKTVLAESPSDYQEAVLLLLEDFIESCQTGKEPEVNALDGMAGMALTLSAAQSARTGQTVSMVEPFYGADDDKIWSWEKRKLKKELKKEKKNEQQKNEQNQKVIENYTPTRQCDKIQMRASFFQKRPKNSRAPLDIADKIARRIMSRHEVYPSYTTDMALEGLLYLFDASGNEEYLNHVLKVWAFRAEKNAATLDWRILFVCLHFETFLRTGEVKYINTFMEIAKDFREKLPRDFDGAVAYEIRPENQRIFIDMLQGYAIFMARAGWLSGDVSFFDECVNQYQIFRDILRNPKTGLWHQGRGWGPESHQISPGHWNRGQGWVLRGMVESLCYFPKSYSKQALMLNILRDFADSLIKYQDSRGMWHQVTDHPAAYQETSGTAMFVHYLYKAIQNGWLPKKTYLPVVEKGLSALLGFIHKDGLVSNTSHGSGPLMTLEGYLHRPSVPGEPHSIGTTLMACAAPYLSGTHPRIKAGPPVY
jgi:rhamnogalacturonyl hydrolase YesR/predicted dehydrogenase